MTTLQNQLSELQKFLQIVETTTQLPKQKSALERFHEICRQERIPVIEYAFPDGLEGMLMRIRNRHGIFINPNLTDSKKALVAFHELGHFFLGHTKDVHCYNEISDSIFEFEANLFAKLALMERSTFESLSIKVAELNLFLGSLEGENNEIS